MPTSIMFPTLFLYMFQSRRKFNILILISFHIHNFFLYIESATLLEFLRNIEYGLYSIKKTHFSFNYLYFLSAIKLSDNFRNSKLILTIWIDLRTMDNRRPLFANQRRNLIDLLTFNSKYQSKTVYVQKVRLLQRLRSSFPIHDDDCAPSFRRHPR